MKTGPRNRTFMVLAWAFVGVALVAATRVPRGIGPGRNERPHLGVAVQRFDSRWIPVRIDGRNILEALRELRLETSTMWFRVDCGADIYTQREIELVFQGGTLWVAAGQPKPTAKPARCVDDRTHGVAASGVRERASGE